MVDVGILIGLLGVVGSPADVATLIVLLFLFRSRIEPQMETIAAAVVLVAREHDRVAADRVADELDVDDADLDDVRPVKAHGPDQD